MVRGAESRGLEVWLPSKAERPGATSVRALAHDTAARLVDDLLPAVPYRRWVLSFPFQLRFALARNPQLFGKLPSSLFGIVCAWQRHRCRRLGITDGQTGSVTFLQRFGGP